MKTRQCDCKYWKKDIPTILSAFECADLLSNGVFKTHEITWFEYCPWCGKKLAETGEDVKEYTLDNNFMPKKLTINLVDKEPKEYTISHCGHKNGKRLILKPNEKIGFVCEICNGLFEVNYEGTVTRSPLTNVTCPIPNVIHELRNGRFISNDLNDPLK